ncbi:MAG: Large extracellular alpha-helical protein, partial [Acidobacteria bacterium]|nr:Large extracellular alpha-helical protein [Acidobacteriota bacterium]
MPMLSFLLSLLLSVLPAIATSSYDTLRQRAEADYAEKSFGRAHEAYEEAAKLDLQPEERRWVAFRLADTAWRSDAASPSPDPTVREAARKALAQFVEENNDDRDRIWAEAEESLGDFSAAQSSYDYSGGQYYVAALDWWAGSADLELARQRYLDLLWKLLRPRQQYGQAWEDGSRVPRAVLVNAVEIARTPRDRDRARWHLAVQFFNDQSPRSVERGFELLDQIIADGNASDWYDDALFAYGTQLAQRGGAVISEQGDASLQQDYVRALGFFRRITTEFTKEQTRYYDDALAQIRAITTPYASIEVGSTFLPDSEQQVVLSWRNLKEIELSVTPIDLTKLELREIYSDWLRGVPLDPSRAVRRWTFETHDAGDYTPAVAQVRIAPRLPAGAYVIAASGHESAARRLLLVTDANVILQTLNGRVQLFASSALTGEPLPRARARVWESYDSKLTSQSVETDANGLASVKEEWSRYAAVAFVTAASGRPAYARTQTYATRSSGDQWRIYAFTDRPAYRPEETVQWKFIARTGDGEQWQTPAGTTLHYDIVSPRGEAVASGEAKLGPFGSFWSALPLTAQMPLGQYTIRFGNDAKQANLGSAMLFRLEEYKLPEYRVSVSTPEEKGKRKLYRLGETIEATVEAAYYFGGPVANATVDVRVTSTPYRPHWYPWREYPWYYEDEQAASAYRYGGGQEVLHQTLKTDADGKVTVRIDTPRDGSEQTYTITANVTDSSRRQVSGSGTVRVMRQRYAVYATPQHYIHRPGEKASVDFKAIDANDQPVTTTGTVTVTRLARQVDPLGKQADRWNQESVQTAKIATDAKGEATFTFTPSRNGYYTVEWTSEDRVNPRGRLAARDIVDAATTLWVTERNVTDLDYRGGALEIVVDNETLRAGDRAAVLILTPANGRWVVVTTTTNDIIDTRVVHLDGTVKLLELPIEERHSPNFFITAASIYDRALSVATKRLIVPPAEQFVKVDVRPDREQYDPKQQGSVTITTRDAAGKPVSAEVALSVSDESVTAISADPAGDPRQFFFHDLRQQGLRIDTSVQQQRYVRLFADEKGNLIDEQEKARRDRAREENRNAGEVEDGVEGGVEGGVVGGVAGGVMGGVLAKDEAQPAMPPPVSEAIAVTAMAPAVLETAGARNEYDMAAKSQAAPASAQAVIEVRNDFRSTAFWQPDLVTGPDGRATATFDYPQALTTWRATARAATAGSQFGVGTATAKTNLPLLVRLQAPRFFVAGDRVTISAVVNNNSDAATRVKPALDVEGVKIVAGEGRELDVPAHGEGRADWTVLAERAGNAKLRVTARDAAHGDAMEKSFVVYEHGIDKLLARSGKLRSAEATVRLDLPRERRGTKLDVQVAPSLATTMLDALPYLIDFPYGCTEQTMSRFLPAAIVARTLARNGLDAGDIDDRIFGGIEQQSAAATHPKGKRDLRRLDEMTSASMKRLYDFQHGDGGWGWWKDGSSDDFMTAYVVWGFAVAKEGGLPVRAEVVERAVRWLDGELVKQEDDPHGQSWTLHAIAAWRVAAGASKMTAAERKAFDGTFKNREHLTAYSRALLALAAHDFGQTEQAKVLIRNLEDGVKLDRKPDQSILVASTGGTPAAETMATAHWGSDRFWWRWYEGPVETTAFALQALVTVDPGNKLVEPVMNWLVKNRRGAQWNNTRDTAITLLALNDCLQASGELAGDVSFDVT